MIKLLGSNQPRRFRDSFARQPHAGMTEPRFQADT